MIGVFDSGEGGLSVLRELVRLLPDEQYIYYSDNANCPYGDKSADFIRDRASSITEYLLSEGADIIVVACNTATAAAIAYLREKYSGPQKGCLKPDQGVGTVNGQDVAQRVLALTHGRRDHVRFIGMEPAVKPAALGTKSGVIGVLATAGTLKGSKYLNTKGHIDDDIKVVEHVGRGFVELVEDGELEGPHAEAVAAASLSPLLEAGADIVVLGCTHYPFLRKTPEKLAGPSVRFIDPAPAVARHTVDVMAEDGIISRESADAAILRRPAVRLVSSGDPTPLHRLFDMIWPH